MQLENLVGSPILELGGIKIFSSQNLNKQQEKMNDRMSNKQLYQIFSSQAKKAGYQIMSLLSPRIDTLSKVAIKPNLVLDKASKSGATTDPKLVAGIIEYLIEHGINNISIMESSWVGASTEKAFKVCGYQKLADDYNLKLIDLEKDDVITKEGGDYQLKVHQSPFEIDYLINVPVLKAHCQTKMTCALKNIKGCIPDSEKRRFHTLGLHGPIAALNTIIDSDLIIVDGIVGDLTFEEGGNPVQMNRVLGGFDPVLIDTYVAQLLALKKDEVKYISYAEKLGVGSSNFNRDNLTTVELDKEVSRLENNVGEVNRLSKYIKAEQVCSSCYASLLHALKHLDKKGYDLVENQFKIGQGFKGESISGIGIGSCTIKAKNNINGCPPEAGKILRELMKII